MEDNSNQIFLNLVVQNVILSNIQEFMQAWFRQECKDFRFIFIQKKDASKEEKQAIAYALFFTKIVGAKNLAITVSSESELPKAQQTRFLKDTTIFPTDKLEILRLRNKYKKSSKNTL